MTEKELNIDLPADEDGFLPRQCPNCNQKFSIHTDTYEQRHYLNLRCPYCGWIEEFDEFLTQEQAEYAEAVAQNELRRMAEGIIDDAFEDAFSGFSSDFIDIETETEEADFGEVTAPSPQINIDTQAINCSTCGFKYKVRDDTENESCPVCR